MEFVSTLAPSSRTSTEEARGSSSPPDPTMSNKHGCSGRNLESDLHNQLLCRSQFPSLRLLLTSYDLRWIFTYKKGRLHLMKIILSAAGVLPLWWCDFSFWEARNVKGGVELMGLDMLILDSTLKFRNHSEVLRLANKNTHLPDLIFELTAVKSIVSDPTQGKHRVMTGGLQLLPVMMMLQEA
uniref:Uncharacterized protein n=1 Tax=Brassica oleracea var. oleracea TaxID=109376 RepID=A0A0D3BZV4_BRAOL